MGICSSSSSTDVATAKLVLQDGRLQEFSYPVKVSYLLQKNPTCFICNADEMDFDDVLLAVNDDEELQVGQLYFALPLSKLKHPLQPEEMAALAVKASSALMKGRGGEKFGCGRKPVAPLVFQGRAIACDAGGGLRRGRNGGGSGGKGKFTALLSAIPE
ncbi:hypothetical protein I3843_01G026600 [Carya illinoinensis]|uniref:Uncharacterized protein n=1 Tax=Carya illinoinensis TaxID=32201 RepID=A0A8T1RHD5_CARIL|nr:uncharacterized protein LOC122306652 [Carya illinoinensis]KAG2724640.1 hypothetical protein I3760_01G028200 [Carya illinoinensis]KAG6666408.1 hypothetical protein CIPAW_01G030000 [Carya illinoinensis]KAG6729448.1 hypothetical protein I3842_01G030500 [Carya illinoinensis]KAG7993844.1 hypothetical protein I3843_01G026600 [Carya illinoinensis]